jgi:hypothetical protein
MSNTEKLYIVATEGGATHTTHDWEEAYITAKKEAKANHNKAIIREYELTNVIIVEE